MRFGGERIGLPPLSLADSIAQSAITPKPFQFGARLPRYAVGNDAPSAAPDVRSPSSAEEHLKRDDVRNRRSARVSRSSDMPIIEPDSTVEYALTIVPPNPAIDFKMVIKAPPTPMQAAPAR